MDIQNEQGVIVELARVSGNTGIEIMSIQTEFPDAVINWRGTPYVAEFEFAASNFIRHGHDIRGCDIIICWVNDWPDCVLPVVALSCAGWENTEFDFPDKRVKETEYWRLRAMRAERKLKCALRERSEAAPGHSTLDKASVMLAENPDISGSEVGRRLGVSERRGQQVLAEVRRNGHS